MLKISLLSILLIAPLSARAASPVVRTKAGALYEIPAGWQWGGFGGYGVTIASGATQFEIKTTDDYGQFFEGGWDSKDVDEQRSFPGGSKAHWRVGPRYGMHYAFTGVAMVDGKGFYVTILDDRMPKRNMKLVASAFESMAQSLTTAAKSTAIYHPTRGFSAEPLEKKFWYNESEPRNISYKCWNDGRTGGTTIYAYPAAFQDAGKALADITGHFEKSASLKIGKIQRAAVSGGEALWTEQPGSPWPFLAAVRRDGRVFFISVNAATAAGCTRPASSEDVLAVARSLRSWDGK